MNIVQIVQRMERAGITLQLHDGKLQVLADKPLTEAQRTFMKDRRAELIHYLQVMNDPHVQTMQMMFAARVQAIHANENTSV